MGSANFTIANSFTNTANLELTSIDGGYSSQLNMPAATLTNGATGNLYVFAGAGGGRVLAVQLVNQGTMTSGATLNLNRASAAHLNSGTITMTGASDLNITQTGTTPSFTNTGTINAAPGNSFAFSNGTIDLTAGVVTGSSSYFVTTGTPTVRFTAQTVQPRVGLSAGSILPDPFVIANGDSLRVYGSFAPPSLTNNGLLLLEGTGGVMNTALTTGATSIIRVRGGAAMGSTNFTIANGFTNNGAIELTSIDGGYSATLTMTGATLTNAAGATLTSVAGQGGGRTLQMLMLENLGTFTVNSSTTANHAINQYGTLNVNAPAVLTVQGVLTLFTGSSTSIFGTINKNGGCVLNGTPTLLQGTTCP